MDKKRLGKIGMATMAGVSEAELARDSAKYFHIALSAMRAAHVADRDWSGSLPTAASEDPGS